ncbi:DedA family protein [Corynebacterium tapiri]|uniref:DedA family protein n=1 Tax=Corynebacterium tapiri TaxID=1448266 RepID=UPI001FE37BF4|nr:hypothetical protein [Corynebacterium tapiri]
MTSREPQLPAFLERPTRVDMVLMAGLMFMVVYGFVLIPLRGWLLTHPYAYTILGGGYTSAVVGGANASVGNGSVIGYVALTMLGAIKFQILYYFLGRRWGREFIDMSVSHSPRLKSAADKLVDGKHASAWTMGLIPLGYCPGPVPNTILNALLGVQRVPFWIFLALNLCSIAVVNGVMGYLGFIYGEPVLHVIKLVDKYLLWVTLALLAVLFFQVWRRQRNLGS